MGQNKSRKKQSRKNKEREKRKPKKIIKFILKLSALLFLLALVIGIFYFYNTYGRILITLQQEAKNIVRSSNEEQFRSSQTSLVYDVDGEHIATLRGVKDVYYIEYKDIPASLLNAIIITEDKKFFSHEGVDYLANIRAAIALIKNKGDNSRSQHYYPTACKKCVSDP